MLPHQWIHPKCNKERCKKEKNVLKTKRKTVLAADLAPACKTKKYIVPEKD
jgi:hypothetical protein